MENKHGLCVGGPMDGTVHLSSKEWFECDKYPELRLARLELESVSTIIKTVRYIKKYLSDGTYQWVYQYVH